jgi:hypothetical protein
MAAVNLADAIRDKEGVDAARAFYEAELQERALDLDLRGGVRCGGRPLQFGLIEGARSVKPLLIPNGVRQDDGGPRALCLDLLGGVRGGDGRLQPVDRHQAAYNLFIAITDKENVDAARAFYEAELREPAAAADAPEEVKTLRTRAAFNLFFSVSEKEGIARSAYETENRERRQRGERHQREGGR